MVVGTEFQGMIVVVAVAVATMMMMELLTYVTISMIAMEIFMPVVNKITHCGLPIQKALFNAA
jgi:hypothetical protein